MALAQQIPNAASSSVTPEMTSAPSATPIPLVQPTLTAGLESAVNDQSSSALQSSQHSRPPSSSDTHFQPSQWNSGVPTDIVPPFEMSDIASDQGMAHAADGSGTLESALFILPFPAPINAHRSKNTPPFLVYSPPREMYKKPAKNDEGKRPREKILKKVVRKWQEEVVMGDRIKRGEIEKPTRIRKIRGSIIRVASTINKWLPNSCIETLSRLPPQSKLGSVTLIHPAFERGIVEVAEEDRDLPYVPTSDELRNDFRVLLRKTRKRILKRAILDVFAPVFAFEINVTYFAFQIYGLKKAKSLMAPRKKIRGKRAKKIKNKEENAPEEATLLVGNAPAEVPQGGAQESHAQMQQIFRTMPLPSPALDPILVLMYDICAKIDPVSFPPRSDDHTVSATPSDSPPSSSVTLPPTLKRPGGAVVKEMIDAFKQILPPEVAARYLLDEERVSEDLARYIKKASQEYIDSLSGRGDRKGVIVAIKTWRKKSIVKKEQAAQVAREKRLAKKQQKET